MKSPLRSCAEHITRVQLGSKIGASHTGARCDQSDRHDVPVLWHLKVSNYNEKARWALDYKCVQHVRRAIIPGRHAAIAERLTGGRTFPILVLGGRAIGDSTQIIEALEQHYPDPPLYPTDTRERRLALELEDFFDEQLGPHARLLCLHSVLPDPKLLLATFAPDLSPMGCALARVGYPRMRRGLRDQFGINDTSVTHAYDKLVAAGQRFRACLQPSGYLVGNRFSVADLTLAALLAPLVAPPEFPYPQPQRGHPRLTPVREALAAEGLLYWTHDMYARHRAPTIGNRDNRKTPRKRWATAALDRA